MRLLTATFYVCLIPSLCLFFYYPHQGGYVSSALVCLFVGTSGSVMNILHFPPDTFRLRYYDATDTLIRHGFDIVLILGLVFSYDFSISFMAIKVDGGNI